MRTFKITITTKCSDAFFEQEGKILKRQVESGELRRDLKTAKGTIKVTVTWEEIK